MDTSLHTEEDVKIKFLLPLLEKLGYKLSHCEFEKAIEVQEGRKQKTIYADVVIYASAKKNAPLIVCDTKAPDEPLDKFAKEQAISYARLLPQIAPLALITNGSQVQVFQTLNKNRIPELPHRNKLDKDILEFLISSDLQEAVRAEARHELFIIDDVQTFKNILKACHNEIRNNEGYDPTEAFDEMSKVLFCKLHEEKHSGNNRFRVSVFDDVLSRVGVNVIKQIFDETKVDARYAGLFTSTASINLQDRTVRKIVRIFEDYDLSLTAFDVKGEAYEYFLGDTFTGGLGEYFTPRNVVEFMVDALDPKIGNTVVDPFCGTGGFLIYAFETIGEKIRLQEFAEEEKDKWRYELSNKSLFGTDWKERTSQACKMNMMVHGDGNAGIFKHDGLTDVLGFITEGKFDICVTNPPFGSIENDSMILGRYDLGSGRKSQERMILGIERAVRLVKPNKWVGIVVIDGVLNNSTTAYVRDYIRQNTWIKAVVSLSKKTFEGYGATAKTSILILQKKEKPDSGSQNKVFMAIASNTGYAANGAPIAGNELPDILLDYKNSLKGNLSQHHSNTWTTDVGDRLDAEFYLQNNPVGANDNLNELQKEIDALLSQINSEYIEVKESVIRVFASQELRSVKLSEILEEVQDRETIVPEKIYRLLGVSWHGAGAFVREDKRGKEIKAKYLYKVKSGWLIYNRLFAFRGSFALLQSEHDGCYVSSEFPTFSIKKNVENPSIVAKYVVHCMNSPYFQALVNAQSTGSTKESRNRFNQKLFLNMEINLAVDSIATEQVVNLLDRADMLRSTQATLLERMKNLRQGISSLLPHP
jgi:type I restriction enzyme M protein